MNSSFLRKGEEIRPVLLERRVGPLSCVRIAPDPKAYQGWGVTEDEPLECVLSRSYGNGEGFTLDFGEHCVGYLSIKIGVNKDADSPLHLRLTFGEMPCEIGIPPEDYQGGLSSSWLQQEIIHIDLLPGEIRLPRRYAFRYLKVEILGKGTAYRVRFEDIFCMSVSSADRTKLPPVSLPEDLEKLDQVACKTLEDCMQGVFEDGPKRDRRLWIGDLRLQALANYKTFDNRELVKRCLYYFAGLTLENGQVPCCVYTDRAPTGHSWPLIDYALFFVSILYDWQRHTGDLSLVEELWETAKRQMEIAWSGREENGLIAHPHVFIDWCPELDRQASLQGVVLYTFRQGAALAKLLGDQESEQLVTQRVENLQEAVRRQLYDSKRGLFVSGPSRQLSYASNVWLVLGKALDLQGSRQVMEQLLRQNPPVTMHTPYMFHHFVQALIDVGMSDEALNQLKAYWGGMLERGADCFWEAYNPEDPMESPYGDKVINSYCHAWSCTPAYFIREYFAR